MKIVGISGTNGSGKDTVGKILQDEYGFLFVSVTDILRNELIKRGQTPEREYLRELSAEWRRKDGLGILIDKAIKIYESKDNQYNGLVVSSLRNAGEADRVHELGGKVVWVDANPEIRYKRISGRGRGAEDDKTYEEFLGEEQDEMKSSGDETTIAVVEVKKLCDIFLENNTEDINIFKADINNSLQNFLDGID
ncbi:MAG TPA: AAA family ATPase [Patescibacteria group bacterium]|nr:AAA family ATPase [Patescibacteria group bacterium]